ncbi:bactofilin family protein [Yersinia pekkanenii]|uniref:Integral membrane protein CcmA involved in cell shape determination n=1 Tax=Yersinia pekkanenii TaxID=1288385 RepID=A0A0T9PEL9_9GAMM|nr:polymer-forming cytoskeletal protein [Yersinia pekkanenii]CNH61274.1 Integral membrane protein CcmA involved in cell shape determination [Yersinia pekkanenii]CRY66513.1 Integral membrane protein CcmA involved in cell shape determination [Yersinia pekkanenii]
MSLYMHKNITLSLFWLLWIACLVSYIVYNLFFYLLLAPTLFLMFILVKIMFKKKNNTNSEVSSVIDFAKKVNSALPDMAPDTTKINTVIAAGTQLKGDVNLDGDIQVYGVVIGDITVNEGTIRLMRSGQIEGNLTAPHITVDGRVEGVCVSEHLEILENGRLNGIVKGSNFSIKKGGIFIGQSEITEESSSQNKSKIKPVVVARQESIQVIDETSTNKSTSNP